LINSLRTDATYITKVKKKIDKYKDRYSRANGTEKADIRSITISHTSFIKCPWKRNNIFLMKNYQITTNSIYKAK
jgi:hypothetical protein